MWEGYLDYQFEQIERKISELKEKSVRLRSLKIGEIEKVIADLISSLNQLFNLATTLKINVKEEITTNQQISLDLQRQLEVLKKEKEISEADLRDLRNTLETYQLKAKKLVFDLNNYRNAIRKELATVHSLFRPPLSYGFFVRENSDGTVDLEVDSGTLRGTIRATISDDERKKLKTPGQKVILTPPSKFSPGGNVLRVLDECEERGEEVTVDEILSKDKLRIITHHNEKEVVFIGGSLKDGEILVGDKLLFDRRSGFVVQKLPRQEASDLMLEEIPNITYAQIGGQEQAIRKLRELIEYPFVYPHLFAKYQLKPPRGLILWGPPGCGKTMSLKAIANSLQQRLGQKVILLTILGPQLLSKWIGEPESKIREPFQLAKVKAKEGVLVLVLFDEIEAMFLTRGTYTGSAGVYESSVTQFSTMLDGLKEFPNIIVIGTTNRPDLIDPALTRPGRLYPPIEFPRPDKEGVREILRIYLRPLSELVHQKYINPSHPQYQPKYKVFEGDKLKVIEQYFIQNAIALIFPEEKAFTKKEEDESLFARLQNSEKQKVITIKYVDTGEYRVFYMKDLISGAIIANIVERTQLKAILAEIAGQEGGLRVHHLLDSIEEIFREGEALPSRTNPAEWARILGIPITRPFQIVEEERKEEKPRKGRTTI